MKKITFAELEGAFHNCNETHQEADQPITGVIVFASNNWEEPYSETERSYRVRSNNRRFQSGKISNSFYGDCLDGKDRGVRLDWYNWKPDFCYLDDESNLG